MRVSSFPSFVRGDTVTMDFKTGLDLAHVSSAVLVIEQCGYTITKEGDALEVSGGSVRGTLTPSESMTLIPGRVSVQLSLRFEDGTVFSSDPETWMVENRVGGSTGSSTVLADAEFSAYVGIPVPAPHPDLEGRDLPDQHPITAVTGLEDALASKADGVATAQALATKADADATERALADRVGRDEFSRAMDGKADTAALTGEAMLRTEGDTALRMLISDEVRDRRDAVASEASARDAAVSSLSTRIDRKQDQLTAGQNVVIRDGVISAAGTEYGQATNTAPGLMSASDKAKLDSVARGAEPNVIESVRVNGSPLTVTADGAVNVDLTGYATKADLSTIPKWDKVVVDQLPTTGIQLDKIYLVPNSGSGTNSRDEYIYVDGKWELIGTTETDISGKQDVITGAASTVTSANLTAGRVLVSDSAGKIVADSLVTVAELRFLDGVKSNIQTQMDAEAVARADADADIRRVVDAEVSARDAAVKAEATARANAVATLQSDVNGRVSKAGDTMTGDLMILKDTALFTCKSNGIPKGSFPSNDMYGGIRIQDAGDVTRGIYRFAITKNANILQLVANDVNGGNPVYLALNSIGYGSAPSWSVGTNDNSDKILTMKMANSLPSLVHTTGIETIAGTKKFTSNIKDPQHDVTFIVSPNSNALDTPYYCLAEVPLNNQGAYNKSISVFTAHESQYYSENGGYAQLRISIQYNRNGEMFLPAFYMMGSKKGLTVHDPDNWILAYNQAQDKMQLWVKENYSQTNIFLTVDARLGRNELSNNWTLLPKSSGFASLPSVDDGWVHVPCVDKSNLLATSTPSDAIGTEIATADWVNAKYVKLTGGTMTGILNLEVNGGDQTPIQIKNAINGNTSISFANAGKRTGLIRTSRSDTINRIRLYAFDSAGEFTNYTILDVVNDTGTGERYATVNGPANASDNSIKIATTAWVNTASSVVHTTGIETIAGTKKFTENLNITASGERGTIITRMDKALGDTWSRYRWDRTYDKNSFLVGDVLVTNDANSVSHSIGAFNKTSDGTIVTSRLTVYALADGTVFANAPATRANGYSSTNIATAGWVDSKIASQRAETWTFTLDDGSTVTKEVLVR